MKRKKRMTGTYVFLIIMGCFMGLPLLYLIVTAFKPLEELFLFPPRFWVRRPTMENFADLVMAAGATWVPFTRYIFNSVFVTVVTVGLILIIQSMAAYPLAKHNFPGKNLIMIMTMAAFMFAPQVTQIPRFMVVNHLGMINTYWALIIPMLAQPFMVFLLKQYMGEVPDTLFESAKIDGANQWYLYRRIVLPLIKPALSTVLILTFVAIWNDAFSPIVFIRSESLKTLPVALQTIAGGPGVVGRSGAVAAAAFLTTAPTIIIFVLLQRHVLETMAYSGIKA
jgi:ABC-type glycerol-3-phosphate transport system permease component